MVEMKADASAEKRLFISLLTRDIPLVAAFLDLIDNSINSAIEPFSDRLKTAADYLSIFDDETIRPDTKIELVISKNKIEIKDRARGISAETAKDHVFKFGRGENEHHEDDRLSVYGIGLKRAIFKIGQDCLISTQNGDHRYEVEISPDWIADEK